MTFTELPFEQQQELYRAAAGHVLERHGLAGAELADITFVNNATFQARAGDRELAVRIYRPRQSSGRAIRTELAWLGAIHGQTALSVPRPLVPPDGDPLIRFRPAAGDDALYGVAFAWLPGASPAPAEHTPALAERIGAVIGRLHEHSRRFSPTGEHPRRKLTANQFVFWRLVDRHTPGLFRPEHRPVFAAVERRVKELFRRFAAHDYGLVHADLIWKNILVDGPLIRLIDFESCAWGYYPYDLAPLLLNYLGEASYRELRAAALAGYRSVQPLDLDDGEIDVLIAARHTRSCFWMALHLDNPGLREQAPAAVAMRLEEIAALLNL
ncbi:MAG TPA: phosphotransferase [Herpetosiphonaceae bacterium]|nr:phosphotransferase [Herpetosiphonaceae bacterium]